MANDTLVFDIETQNFFTDPEVGWNNFPALRISVVGIYSYEKDAYLCFEEKEVEQMADLFRNASRLVGFASNRYDIPVLNLYFQKMKDRDALNLWMKDRVDLLEEIEKVGAGRISLSRLAEANLGVKKEGHGSEAPGMYERGEIDALKEYCLKDVKLTKELYDCYLRDRALLVPRKGTAEVPRVALGFTETRLELV